MDWTFVLCGFVVGILVGFTGMGGGSVMTAMLILFFGVHPVTAVGTDLLFAAVTKSVGARVHSGKGNVAWRVVGLLALGSVPGAMMTLLALSQMPLHDPLLARVIKLVIGCALLFSGLSMLFGRNLVATDAVSSGDVRPSAGRAALTVALGLLLGVLVSLTSVGAGAIGLVVLRHLYPNIPPVRLVGSDIAHAVPLTLLAGSGHWLLGDVNWLLLVALLAGSIPGIMMASHYAHRIAERYLRWVLGLLLLSIALSLLVM